MTPARPLAVPIAVLVAAAMGGCGPKRIPQLRPGQAQVVLLPDPGDGAVGRAVVTNPAGAVELAAARESTTASSGQAPAPVTVLSEADVNLLFGDLLSTLPPAPQQFVLYFRFESDDLTDESRALLPRVVEALRNRPFPDVAVIGHTDTTGAAAANVELGLRRANAIRAQLVQAGINPGVIEVTSHGESDLLVKTADQVLEARNRRVEITVR
jgi:outer membrane protein OmpA-like peptidoglycan-associated protein